MKKITLLSLIVLTVMSCGSGNGDDGSGGALPFLITGRLEQAGVTYITDVTEISFSQTSQDGDSTFFEANLDVDANNSTDLKFQLVTWTDNTVLTIRPIGYAITASSDNFELIGTEVSLESLQLFPAETELNSSISGFTTGKDLFISHILNGNLTTASQSIWNGIAYLPFASATRSGWVGLNIKANGNDIQGIGINTIAFR